MAQENTQRNEQEYVGYDKPQDDTRLLGAEEGLQRKVTDWEKDKKAANETQAEQEAQNDAQYQYEVEQLAIAEAQEITRRTIARKQAVLKERQAARIVGKARGVTSLARWSTVGIAFTLWFWQFICAGISLVGIGMWATLSELVNGNIIGRAINWGLSFFGTSVESLIPVDSFALAFWALATIIAICSYVGFIIFFFLTGVRFFDTPLIALVTIPAFALSILPVSNLFPWIPLWVIIVNARSTVGFVTGVVGGPPK